MQMAWGGAICSYVQPISTAPTRASMIVYSPSCMRCEGSIENCPRDKGALPLRTRVAGSPTLQLRYECQHEYPSHTVLRGARRG